VNEQVFLHLQNLNSTFTGFDISSIIIITFFNRVNFSNFQIQNAFTLSLAYFLNCDVIVKFISTGLVSGRKLEHIFVCFSHSHAEVLAIDQ